MELLELVPENTSTPERAGLEETLPPESGSGVPENQAGASVDGLAAEVAAEQSLGSETPGGGEATANGKRKGRPPIHGLYSKAAGSDGKNPVRLPGQTEIPASEGATDSRLSAVIPPDMLAKVIQETLSVGEAFTRAKIESVAAACGLTSAEVEPLIIQTEMGQTRKELVGELVPLAAKEWGVDPQLSPTAAIGMLLGPWAVASVTAYISLARLAQERQAHFNQPGTKP